MAAIAIGVGLSVVLGWNQERERSGMSNPHCHDTSLAIQAAVEAVRILIQDEQAASA